MPRGVEYSNLGPPTSIELPGNGKIGALVREVVSSGDGCGVVIAKGYPGAAR